VYGGRILRGWDGGGGEVGGVVGGWVGGGGDGRGGWMGSV